MVIAGLYLLSAIIGATFVAKPLLFFFHNVSITTASVLLGAIGRDRGWW